LLSFIVINSQPYRYVIHNNARLTRSIQYFTNERTRMSAVQYKSRVNGSFKSLIFK